MSYIQIGTVDRGKIKIISGSPENYKTLFDTKEGAKLKSIKYEYKGIKLCDPIEKIIDLLTPENTKFDKFNYLEYKPGTAIEDIETRIFIYLYTGKIIFMKIFDEEFFVNDELKIWNEITEEIIKKYKFYFEEEDADEDYYLSKKYKEFVLCVDFGNGRIKKYTDFKQRILGYNFDDQNNSLRNFFKDEIDDYLKCKNLKEIYYSLEKSRTLDVDILKREVTGQLDDYKFTFDLLTRNIKNIDKI